MRTRLNVLIVDDEYIIRNWLSMLMEKHAGDGIALVGAASSGPAAIKMCQDEPVDVVITDIKMSPMTGIELIKTLKPLYPRQKYVIISNYDDFSAAQEGLRLGASEYFLKAEVEDVDILQCLKNLGAQIEDEARALAGTHADVSDVELLRQHLLINLMRDNPLPDAGFGALKAEDIALDEDGLCVVALSRDHYRRELRFTSGEYQRMLKLITAIAARHFDNAACLINQDGNILAVMNRASDGSDRRDAFAREAISEVNRELKLSLSAAIAGPVDGYAALAGAYRAALAAFEQRFYTEGRQVCRAEAARDWIPFDGEIQARLTALGEHIHQFELSRAYQDAQALLTRIGAQRAASPESVHALCEKLMRLFAPPEGPLPAPGDAQPQATSALSDIPLFSDLQQTVLKLIDQRLRQRHSAARVADPIEQAVRFIKENYRENLSLAVVASRVHMSESYLSKLFKEKTGVNFHHYLSRLRINHAKYLLRNSNARIGSIGLMVGYPNDSYFTQVFKKITGLSPEQYRGQFGQAQE